jgi:hypothetical protein
MAVFIIQQKPKLQSDGSSYPKATGGVFTPPPSALSKTPLSIPMVA